MLKNSVYVFTDLQNVPFLIQPRLETWSPHYSKTHLQWGLIHRLSHICYINLLSYYLDSHVWGDCKNSFTRSLKFIIPHNWTEDLIRVFLYEHTQKSQCLSAVIFLWFLSIFPGSLAVAFKTSILVFHSFKTILLVEYTFYIFQQL